MFSISWHEHLWHNSLILVLYLQILGAFADRDGVPMQGMKIKNVVPGKNCVSLWNCSGQSIAYMSLDISLLRHSNLALILFYVLLGCFCCLWSELAQ